jgi:hypothetical protein
MNKTDKKQPDEFVLEVTQEEYDEAMAKGWNDDDIQKPGKYRYRRATRFANPGDLHPSNTTVYVKLPVRLDVLQHFEERAKQTNSISYEELMSAELHAAMQRNQQSENNQSIENLLLADERFIAAVAKKVVELQSNAELKAA